MGDPPSTPELTQFASGVSREIIGRQIVLLFMDENATAFLALLSFAGKNMTLRSYVTPASK